MAKNLISLILIPAILLGSPGVNYALRPMATALLEMPKVKKGMVHIKDLQTGKSKTITRAAFLSRLTHGKLKNVMVTERLDKKGVLRLRETAYGEPYIVCERPRHRNRLVQYQIKDGIAVNIAFIGKRMPFERHNLAVVKGLLSKPVDSFLPENTIPERVDSLVHRGMASSIENLSVGKDNSFRYSFAMAYSFSLKGNFAGKELNAYFWGRERPLQFSIRGDYGRHNDIYAGEVLIASEKAPTRVEQQEIREALFMALYEIPLRIRSLAMAVLMDLPRFVDATGIKKLRLAEHFDLRESEIDRLVAWFRKSESLKKVIDRYGIGRISASLKKSILKYRLEIKPPPIPEDGRILIRNIMTKNFETVDRKELVRRYKSRSLRDREVIYDRLDSRGRYVLGTHKTADGKRLPNLLFDFAGFPNHMIRYIVHNGEANRATVILLDEEGYPLEGDKIRYAVNANTGELMCHFPFYIRLDFRETLDNVVVCGRLDKAGSLNFGTDDSGNGITVASFTSPRHRGRRVRFRVVNGEVDKTSVVLLNEDGTVYRGDDTRYAVVSETGDIQCHLPDKIHADLRRQLDGMTIYDKLDGSGMLHFGETTPTGQETYTFSSYPWKRVRYKVRNGRVDRTTILLLNKDGSVFKSPRLRYAVEPRTDEIRCHLPDVVHKALAKELNGLVVYDRLMKDGRGSFAESKAECIYKRFKGKRQRYKFAVKDAKMDRTTILLLNRNGTVLEDDSIRRVVYPETGKIRCHLPDYLSYSLKLLLEGMLAYDNLDNTAHIWLEPSKEQCIYEGHANRQVKYKFKDGKIDRTTLILLDDKGSPLDDGETMYAIDLETGGVKFHLPKKRLSRQWLAVLDNVEVVNAGLDDSNGALWIKGLPRYVNLPLHGHKIRYKIYKNRLVSITVIAKNGDIVLKEILDEAGEAETFPARTDIKYAALSNGDRVIAYSEFADKICDDYNRFLNNGMAVSKVKTIMQKRLYELFNEYTNIVHQC